jgi:endoglucanase
MYKYFNKKIGFPDIFSLFHNYPKKINMKILLPSFLKKQAYLFLTFLCISNFSFADCVETFDNFNDPSGVSYSSSDGTLTTNASNPTSNYINGSSLCAKYLRSTQQYDNLTINSNTVYFGNGDYYKNGHRVFKMDVYSPAAGISVTITLTNGALAAGAYPAGRHSLYSATTTKANEWETLVFVYAFSPDATTPGEITDQAVIQFAPNTTSSATYYFDNFVATTFIGFDDADYVRGVTYQWVDGTLNEAIANPGKDDINSSTKSMEYIRPSTNLYAGIVMKVTNIWSGDNYKDGLYTIKMDVYSPASGIVVNLVIGNEAASAGAYPAGRHSFYSDTTKTSGEWETLEFAYIYSPDPAVSSSGIDQMTIQFAPNTNTGATFYWDNLVAFPHVLPSGSISGPSSTCIGQTGVSFYANAVAGCTYTWMLPANVTIASGSGTNSITADFDPAYAGGFFAVQMQDALGCVSWQTISVAAQGSACISELIRLNQIGYYPNSTKLAVISGNPAAGSFTIKSTDLATTYFTGTLGNSALWDKSNETVRIADFSAFTTPGTYVVFVNGTGRSYTFEISENLFNPLVKGLVKAYYYNRCSIELLPAYAGVYARPAGHPDNQVLIHSSAASANRPTGTIISSTKGWYDAGDYNSYIVNSGISTFTLLSAYEHYNYYFDTLQLNIPESGNNLPDLLNEIKWNLDWMLTMQDPDDGGVYTKKTCTTFDGEIMPAASSCTRYVVKKSTAAAFDFAAVMAVAYRAYLPFDAAYANQCLNASIDAYAWGIANPSIYFTNPADIFTGEYPDGDVTDEKEWAANELLISTKNISYYTNGFKNANYYGVPSWSNVRSLGLISLMLHKKSLPASVIADTTNMKSKLLGLANGLESYASSSPYKVAMGSDSYDFSWGSNAVAGNQGIILLSAYRSSGDEKYKKAAGSSMDYFLGRNATGYSFVTNFGDKTPLNIHHRLSLSDGITAPVPGLVAGGAQNMQNPDNCTYTSNYPATRYLDSWCSYSTNEVAINWNAPFVFLTAGMEFESQFTNQGAGDNFNDNILSCNWDAGTKYTLSESNGELSITPNTSLGDFTTFTLNFDAAQDLSENAIVRLKVKSSAAFSLRADLSDNAGNSTNAIPLVKSIAAGSEYSYVMFDFSNKFSQTWPVNATVDKTNIKGVTFFANPGGNAFSTPFYFEDVMVLGGGKMNGDKDGCTVNSIKKPQIGSLKLYPNPSDSRLFLNEPMTKFDQIEIWNTAGQKVEGFLRTQDFVDVSMLPMGLYLITFSNDKERTSFSFVKQ